MPPTAGTRTSTRQGRATVRPTNYYARTFAGRLAANGLEQTPEASSGAPGFLPALTHFTGAVDAFPKEIINHFSMFKEVEAKLHDPEQMLKDLFDEIAQLPVTTKAQLRNGEQATADPESSAVLPPQRLHTLTPEEQAIKKRQLFYRLRVLMAQIIPTLDEKLVVLQATKVTKDKGLMRMHHSYSQLDSEISDEARYGSLSHWAYADKEEKKKGGTTNHERQRREVASANNLAAAAQHVHDVDSIAAKSEARRDVIVATKRSRHHQVDSDFDDRPAKKPQKRKPLAAEAAPVDNRIVGLGLSSNGAGPHGKRKKTEKALAAATIAAPAMERSLSGALKPGGGSGVRSGSSPRNTPGLESAAASKRKPRAAPAPAQRKNQLPPYSPPLASSPLAANFAINKALAGASDRPLSARARKNSIANSVASASAQDVSNGRRPSSSHSMQQAAATSNAITELEQAAGITRDNTSVNGVPIPRDILDTAPPFESLAMKQEEHIQEEPESMDIDAPLPASLIRAGRTSKTATPVVGSFPEIPMARSRSTRNANNSNSNASSENNSTTTGFVSKRGNKKNAQTASNAMPASPAVKPVTNTKSNPPSSAASSIAAEPENEYPEAEVESDEEGDEPRYCYCNEVSYGNMVACDNDDCPREWFHLACVNLEKAPVGRTKWFCSDECKEMHAKSKAKGGRPGSSRQ